MKSNSLIIILFSTLLLWVSCSRADLDIDDIYHFWMAMSIQAEDTIEPSPANRGKVKLSFVQENKTYLLYLEVSVCSGSYSICGKDSITMTDPTCTHASCNSDFSKKLVSILPDITTYEIKGSQLVLYSENSAIVWELHRY